MLSVLLLLTVFLIPLLPANSYFGFEQIKVLVFIVLTFIITIFWMIEQKGKRLKIGELGKVGGIFLLSLGLTSLLGIDPKTSILGAHPYFQGFILYAYLFLFHLLVRNSGIKFELWSKIILISASLVSSIAIKDWILLNFLHQQIPNYAGRVISSFGQPNFYAGFLLLTLPFIYKLGKFWRIGSLLCAVGILVSYSRSAILLLLVLIILGLFDQFKFKIKWTLAFFGAVFLIILASSVISFKTSSGMIWSETIKPAETLWLTYNSPEKRVFIWPIIGKLIWERPFLGYGLENIQPQFANFFRQINFNTNNIPVYLSLKDIVVDRSHNYILDLLLFSGILGLIPWLILIGLMIRKARGVILVSFLTYFTFIQFQNQSVVHLLFFWLLIGLIDKE